MINAAWRACAIVTSSSSIAWRLPLGVRSSSAFELYPHHSLTNPEIVRTDPTLYGLYNLFPTVVFHFGHNVDGLADR